MKHPDPSIVARLPMAPEIEGAVWPLRRHIAHAISAVHGVDVGIALSNIKRFFDAEVALGGDVETWKPGGGESRGH